LFQWPNRNTEKDFEGWVEERGSEWMRQWDPHYEALLEAAQPARHRAVVPDAALPADQHSGIWRLVVYPGSEWYFVYPGRLRAAGVRDRSVLMRARRSGEWPFGLKEVNV